MPCGSMRERWADMPPPAGDRATQLTIRDFLSEDSSMDSRRATWVLVLGVGACTPMPPKESPTATTVTRQQQVERGLQTTAGEPSRPAEEGLLATGFEFVVRSESPHPKFPSSWRVLVIDSGRLTWERVPIYGAIQDWNH